MKYKEKLTKPELWWHNISLLICPAGKDDNISNKNSIINNDGSTAIY